MESSLFQGGTTPLSPVDERIQAGRSAAIFALVYFVCLVLYLYLSGKWAASHSISLEELARYELVKGVLYATVSGFLIFLGAYVMLKRIEDKNQLIAAQTRSINNTERLVMIGLFSSSVCHDINNILAIVQGNADYLRSSGRFAGEDGEALDQIAQASRNLHNLLDRMMSAGKGFIPGETRLDNLSRVLEESVAFARVHRKLRQCELDADIQQDIRFPINAVLIGRTVMNLILNAADATDHRGHIRVKLAIEGEQAVLEVHDNGPGVPQGMREQIFEPFFTSKEDGNGLGLLSLKICARQHGAEIQLRDSDLGGACFRLVMPLDGAMRAMRDDRECQLPS